MLSKESDIWGRWMGSTAGTIIHKIPKYQKTIRVNGECLQKYMGRRQGQLGPSDRFLLKYTVVLKSNGSLYTHIYARLNPESGILQL